MIPTLGGTMGTKTTSLYDPGAALTCPETRAVFLADALATGNLPHIVAAVGIAVRAFGSAKLAHLSGIAMADLEQLFGIQGDPDLCRLMKVLRVLGVGLSVVPTASIHPEHVEAER
ncbi:MAG: DNA-binding protein [Pseudomonas sp.]